MWMGIDLGTSSVKVVLIEDNGEIISEASADLSISRPQSGWAEQDPSDWLVAVEQAVLSLPSDLRAATRGIGLSGQMHGATVLGADDRPLRTAILWNDTRAAAECQELTRAFPKAEEVSANLVMPGFTAPKLLWLRNHEAETFRSVRSVLLPKDYVRLHLSGDKATDASDAAGTSWLDVAARQWSPGLLEATGLRIGHMPNLFEGNQITGTLRAALAASWGMEQVPIAAGGGDNAASAVGLGAIEPGDSFVSIGTSGVYFVVDAKPMPNPKKAVHCYCHAVPDRWHRMGVILSAAASADWGVKALGYASIEEALTDAEAARPGPYFAPYLAGERTPHNDGALRGAFTGLDANTDRGAMMRAIIEGVSLAIADCQRAIGHKPSEPLALVGGGARSQFWAQMLANALGSSVALVETGQAGAASGAARLGAIAAGNASTDLCRKPSVTHVIEPTDDLAERRLGWSAIHPAIRELNP